MSKVILITGTSSGIGLASAIALAQAGHNVYASMRDTSKQDALLTAAQAAKVKPHVLPLDVESEASSNHAVGEVLRREGHIDVLINNAGYGYVRTLEQAPFDEIEDLMNVNYYGVLRCIRAVLPAMRTAKSGHIITVSSVGGLVGQPMNELYCASKFALEGLIESMATYMEPYFGIKLSLIEPAGTRSDFVKRVMADLHSSGGVHDDAYKPVFDDYMATLQKRGMMSGAGSQTIDEVAQVIADCVAAPAPRLRYPTSDFARAFATEKLQADPDGSAQTARIRSMLLGK